MCGRDVIQETLKEAEYLISFALKVLDITEECLNPDLPY